MIIRRFAIILVVISMDSVSPVAASDKQEEIAIAGAGTFTCAKYGELYRKSPDAAEAVYYNWAQGFMSGINGVKLAANGESKDLGSISQDEQKWSIRNYCNNHPLEDYMGAVMQVYNSLKASKPVVTAPSN
jgi:hypothetical protein